MAKSKVGARNIVVNDVKYLWRANGNDGYISLVIWPRELPGPAITCSFDYGQTEVPSGEGAVRLIRQVVITNRIVRRVVEHATLRFAYDARTKGEQLDLRRMSKVVDISDAIRSS
ncbi:MAG: hypothetical protein Q8L48_32230 [Archangium sp.]|nr:hypothetical protein [Archangium sp.]